MNFLHHEVTECSEVARSVAMYTQAFKPAFGVCGKIYYAQ